MAQRKQPPKPAQAHHHNPRSYLARWTDSGNQEGRLYVHDLITAKDPRHEKPAKCGFVNDLYEVFEDGLERDKVEKWSAINRDDPGNQAIDFVVKKKEIPDQKSNMYYSLIEFIAFAGVRSPAFRALVHEAHAEANKVNKQNAFIKRMLLGEKEIFPWLHKRGWRLWIAQPGAGEFITSDQPMALSNPWNVSFSPGEALKNRDIAVYFPLSASMAMEGLGYDDCAGTGEVKAAGVAIINGFVGSGAHRCLYSRSQDFGWASYSESPVVENRQDFLKAWRERKGIQ